MIGDSGPWYFQVCQDHSALWMPQKPFQFRVLALISKKQPSCNKCLLRILLPHGPNLIFPIFQAFTGPTDDSTEHEVLLPEEIEATHIRIKPLSSNNQITMRVEILGCELPSKWFNSTGYKFHYYD